MQQSEMYVLKRNGEQELVSFDTILARIRHLKENPAFGLELTGVRVGELAKKVIDQLYSGIPTTRIDELTAEQCASMITVDIDYGTLAARIVVSNHEKNTKTDFVEVVNELYGVQTRNCFNGVYEPVGYMSGFGREEGSDDGDAFAESARGSASKEKGLISHELWDLVNSQEARNPGCWNAILCYDRDYLLDYFGFKTLEKAYLMRNLQGVIVERPQHMWLRVALGIHGDDMPRVKETYDLMSRKYFTHATPTLFNAGTPRPQMSSCFLLATNKDSVDGIYDTLKECAQISKWAGGIGFHISNVRAQSAHIRGTNGQSNGLVPMLKLFNDTARFINQGGKRNGSFAAYLEPWHPDIFDFIEMKLNHGDEEKRARDLFYAVWIPDLFMERVKENADWTLMCPHSFPGLADVYGDQFRMRYEAYEHQTQALVGGGGGGARDPKPLWRVVKARDLWYAILHAQMETGNPYMLYKDAANIKSNQKNIGVIKSSNLCCEVTLVSDPDQTAVCNLASIALCMFVDLGVSPPRFNFELFRRVVHVATRNLNCVIDRNFYPGEKAAHSNFLHRPIGLGVQGLADTFILMGFAFNSPEAKALNLDIFETMSFAALEESNRLAAERTQGIRKLRELWRAYLDYLDMTQRRKLRLQAMDELRFELIFDAFPDLERFLWKHLDWLADEEEEEDDATDCGVGVKIVSDDGSMTITDQDETILRERAKALKNIHARVFEVDDDFHISDPFCGAYSSFEGSPAFSGVLQYDMWGMTEFVESRGRHDWKGLKAKICAVDGTGGLRNSTLLAPMPTASTSQILGFNECFEPMTTNMYTRRTLAGEFVVVNKYLLRELLDRGLWSEELKNRVVALKGSIQAIEEIPAELKAKYKTVWEIPMKDVIDMSADRGMFVCQSQSLNLWQADPTLSSLTSMHFYAWKKGLKTGMYYLRRQGAHHAQQFTVAPSDMVADGAAAAAAGTAAVGTTTATTASSSAASTESLSSKNEGYCEICSA